MELDTEELTVHNKVVVDNDWEHHHKPPVINEAFR
jgi:hypothetical protein